MRRDNEGEMRLTYRLICQQYTYYFLCTFLILLGVPTGTAGAKISMHHTNTVPRAQVQDVNLERLAKLAAHLRCLTCPHQTVFESDAPFALEMRHTLQRAIESGAEDEAILYSLRERYGDKLFWHPTLKPASLLLWIAPGFLLLAGVWRFRVARAKANTHREVSQA